MRIFSLLLSSLLVTPTVFATVLPPILDAYPRCDYKILQQISAVNRLGSNENDADNKHDDVLKSALSELRGKASGKGDALILRKVTGELSRDRTTFIQSRLETEIIYRLEADLIELCEEDTSKPIRLTNYDNKGKRQIETAPATIRINTIIKPQVSQQQFSIDNRNISFVSGYHGVNIGANRKTIETLLGQPDNVYQHEKNIFVSSYGNQLWLTFYDDTLIKASHASETLAYSLTKQLPADRHAKLVSWLLDEKFSKGSLLDDVKTFYQEQLQQIHATEFILQRQQMLMRLSFNNYMDIKSAQQQIKLVEVSVEAVRAFSLPELKLPTREQISTLATHLATAPLHSAGWAQLFNQLAVTNYSTIRQQKRLQLYRPELAAVFSDARLTEVQLALFTQEASLPALQQLLSLFSLPTTRQQFIDKYPDAFETLSQLVVYEEQLEINATFTDDDKIDSIILKWL